MAVSSRDIAPKEVKPAERRRAQGIGFLSGAAAERGFVVLMRAAGVALVGVSVVGTFYALQGKPAAGPLRVGPDMVAGWPWLLAAIAAQSFLSVGQWGARQRAQGLRSTDERGKRRRRGGDPRFWLAYLGLLAASAGLNWIAYGDHLIAWDVPWALAALTVVGGDAAAELVIVFDGEE